MYIQNENVVLNHLKHSFSALHFPPTLPSDRDHVLLGKKEKKKTFPHHFKCNEKTEMQSYKKKINE